MPILVDTNVIVDVATHDPNWYSWSLAQLTKYAPTGLIINSIIYTELCYPFQTQAEVDAIMVQGGFVLETIPRAGLFATAKAYMLYRQRGGNRTKPLPDFFIGGHAQATGYAILTRDIQRYKTYFPHVPLITP